MGESRVRTFVYVTVSAGVLTMLASSCRDATQVTLVLTTTASCGADVTSTSIFVASDPVAVSAQMAENSPVAQTAYCSGNTIGTLVLTQGTSTGAVVIVAGGAQCVSANQGCIIARRSFSFLEHTSLTIPIELDPSCENVPCDEYSTCENGTCRSSGVTCADDGTCTNPQQNPVVDAGEGNPSDGSANESGSTSGNDGSSDSGTSNLDSGSSDGSVSRTDSGGGPVCISSVADVETLSCGADGVCTNTEPCCTTLASSVASCVNDAITPCQTRYCCQDPDCNTLPLHKSHPPHPIGTNDDGGVDSGTQGVSSCKGASGSHPGVCSPG